MLVILFMNLAKSSCYYKKFKHMHMKPYRTTAYHLTCFHGMDHIVYRQYYNGKIFRTKIQLVNGYCYLGELAEKSILGIIHKLVVMQLMALSYPECTHRREYIIDVCMYVLPITVSQVDDKQSKLYYDDVTPRDTNNNGDCVHWVVDQVPVWDRLNAGYLFGFSD
ncbi:hypothetical protein BC941DRAFT_513724 [Chlamydoabsidia padenii]|nr:hypothetical protein BC941DRAFT_513724 [Chlamydoabsidia padenii]